MKIVHIVIKRLQKPSFHLQYILCSEICPALVVARNMMLKVCKSRSYWGHFDADISSYMAIYDVYNSVNIIKLR